MTSDRQAASPDATPEPVRPDSRRLTAAQMDQDPSATSEPQVAGAFRLATWFQTVTGELWTWLLIVPVLTFAMGLAGFAVGFRQVDRGVTAVQAVPASTTEWPPTPPTSVAVRLTATSACLETARRADGLIALFLANRRDRASDLLVAYTVASRQCRQDASP